MSRRTTIVLLILLASWVPVFPSPPYPGPVPFPGQPPLPPREALETYFSDVELPWHDFAGRMHERFGPAVSLEDQCGLIPGAPLYVFVHAPASSPDAVMRTEGECLLDPRAVGGRSLDEFRKVWTDGTGDVWAARNIWTGGWCRFRFVLTDGERDRVEPEAWERELPDAHVALFRDRSTNVLFLLANFGEAPPAPLPATVDPDAPRHPVLDRTVRIDALEPVDLETLGAAFLANADVLLEYPPKMRDMRVIVPPCRKTPRQIFDHLQVEHGILWEWDERTRMVTLSFREENP